MTLSTNGKNYISQHFGKLNCFVSSGVSYTDPAGKASIGGTSDVVATLKLDDGGLSRGPGGEVYDNIVTANGGAVTNIDIVWISSNDGAPVGEPQYCAAVATPTPTPTPVPGEAAGEFEFMGVPEGVPTVSLNLSSLIMRQAADYHFEMNDIVITNTSRWPVYLAMEVKLFKGSLSSCPSTGYVFNGLDRTSTKSKRIKTLAPGEMGIYDTDYYQPISIIGIHTVCLLVHGTWTKAEIDAELLPITG